ncbi:hypothetical protein Bca52824_023673 [Brassica carinata]|uniref:C2 domain-containing protein n=1 Tax=Brassica carinata TaxID=52824 RepID=A0A8X7VIX5_BRACI|nr:hypothetical protein Bca52824_023673 [Brassica carinata]
MRCHKGHEDNPQNSYDTALQFVEFIFKHEHGEAMPELLSKFITLLDKEKEEWGGVKGDEGTMTSKGVIQGVVDQPANRETLKVTDNASTSKVVIPATNKNTLKVKIYMGIGWDKDFPKGNRGSPPELFVNLAIQGGKIQKTKVHESSWTPSWGEEFVFPISSLENEELVVEVYDHTPNDILSGKFSLLVSKLKPGLYGTLTLWLCF